MPNKAEKQRRKELINGINKKAMVDFEKNLPMERDNFQRLFDYLDKQLSENDCDDTNKITKEYLEEIGQNNIENILGWLGEHGGYCDCEILNNIEELLVLSCQ